MKPIVKWVGGKTQLLDTLLPLVPKTYNNYYEPFFGGGALYFKLEPTHAILNDFNSQLINVYICCRDHLDELIAALDTINKNHSIDFYYHARSLFNEALKQNELSINSAALFIYLNKAGYNGLYRLNQKGFFNVPSNKKLNLNLYNLDNLVEVSKQLKNSIILNQDFESACETVKSDDFVFFDSPYYNTFDTYQAGGFSKEDHLRLNSLFKRLTDLGAKCMLTNSNEEFIKNLYADFKIIEVPVKRLISSNTATRVGKEIIILNY